MAATGADSADAKTMIMARFKHRYFLISGLLLVILAVGGWLLFSRPTVKQLSHPEYYSFPGGYVFSVPRNHVVDEQAISGIALVYTGSVTGKTIDQIYTDNNISLQPITFLKGKKSSTFKDYVNNTFVPDTKKVLSPDVTTEFTKIDGWDAARVTVTKDGQPLRFIYLKNGQHPVSIVSREETDTFKKVEQSVVDVEKTDLKSESTVLKSTIQTISQQIKDQKAQDLYAAGTAQLHSSVTENNFKAALKAVEVYTQGSITVNGGSYENNEFNAVINFVPLNKDFKPASGVILLKKDNGQWKLDNLILPNPTANKVQS